MSVQKVNTEVPCGACVLVHSRLYLGVGKAEFMSIQSELKGALCACSRSKQGSRSIRNEHIGAMSSVCVHSRLCVAQ